MKLTIEQEAAVRQLVENEVEYYETFYEVYDHVVTSLEERTSIPDLQKAYAEILDQDFGGHGGIEKLEGGRRWNIWKEATQYKRNIFYSFFKWPGVLLLLMVGVLYYYGFHNVHFRLLLFIASVGMLLVPFVVMGLGNVIIRLKTKEAKSSINNISINSMAKRIWKYYLWIIVYNLLSNAIHHFNLFSVSRSTSQAIGNVLLGGLFIITLMYAIATLVTYQREFKKRLAL